MIRFALIPAALMLTGAAFAGTDMHFGSFTGLNVHGGAHVNLHYGKVQKVTVVKGDLSKADLHLSGNTLDISPCKNWCFNVQTLEVDVTSPSVNDIEAHGGGAVKASGDFPKQPTLKIEAHGGGAVDTRAIPADVAHVEAHGGGAVRLQVLGELNAEAHGGGAISYTGNPPRVHSSSHGGGAISKD